MTVKAFLRSVSLRDTRLTTAKAVEGALTALSTGSKQEKRNRQPASGGPILLPFEDGGAPRTCSEQKFPFRLLTE